MMLVWSGCSKSDRHAGPNPDGEPVALTFSLPGIGTDAAVSGGSVASVGTRAGEAVDLEVGVTVRVLAYQRSGATADLNADKYIGQATYQAAKDETGKIVLKPCTVTFDSDGQIMTSFDGASPLRLIASTYDIYALTPAFQLTAGTGTAPEAPAHTNVAHGDDFAASLTENVEVKSNGQIVQPNPDTSAGTITNPDGEVKLTVLDRKCSRISFTTDRKEDKANIVKKVVVKKVELSQIAHSPATVTICEPIPTGTNDGTYDFPTSTFKTGTKDYQCEVTDVLLPKSDAPFNLSIQVVFNDATEADGTTDKITPLNAVIPSLPFKAGYHYNFRLWLQGESIVLLLQITEWDEIADWSTDLGAYPQWTLVGEWKVSNWSSDAGGYPGMTPDINDWQKPDWGESDAGGYPGMTPTPDQWGEGGWDSNIGGYPGMTPTVEGWTPNADWKTDLGNYYESNFGVEGWTDTEWNSDFEWEPDPAPESDSEA